MTIDPKKDASRRCMPTLEWPEPDRLAWDGALQAGDLLDGSGPAAHWADATKTKTARSYGRFLTFLGRRGGLDPAAGPAERVTSAILRAYIDELREQVAPVTLAQRITELHEALRVMTPDADIGFINRVSRRLWAAAKPVRSKQSRVVHPQRLLDLGLRLMADAETASIGRQDWRASRYRDGLMIAMLACRSLRRSNFTTMRIGRHITRQRTCYVFRFETHKGGKRGPIEFMLPDMLTPFVARYLETYRPILLKGNSTDCLWVSYLGRPMAHGAIYDKVRKVTEEEFGHPINLHMFRDCQATFQAIEDPAHVGIVPSLLGHSDPRTAERYYNQASTADAAKRYQSGILSLRSELRRSLRRTRKK